MVTEESREGPTPNGGVRSTIYYTDDEGRPADKRVATQTMIAEFGADGTVVHRTYGHLQRRDQS